MGINYWHFFVPCGLIGSCISYKLKKYDSRKCLKKRGAHYKYTVGVHCSQVDAVQKQVVFRTESKS